MKNILSTTINLAEASLAALVGFLITKATQEDPSSTDTAVACMAAIGTLYTVKFTYNAGNSLKSLVYNNNENIDLENGNPNKLK